MSDLQPETPAFGADGKPSSGAVLRGGVIMVTRQLLGYVLKLIGLFLVTRILGPTGYAPYVAALGLVGVTLAFMSDGLNNYLVLQGGSFAPREEATVYSILAAASALIVGAVFVSAGWIADAIRIPEATGVLRVMVFYAPFQLLMLPALARLERQLNYRRIATVELSAQAAFYLVAAPLVISGVGGAGMAAGMVAQYLTSFALSHVLAGCRPIFGFDRHLARKAITSAAANASVSGSWALRALVNPLVIAPRLGAHAVGIQGMANTVIELAGFAKNIVYRVLLAFLGHHRDDPSKLRETITQGLQGQTLVVGSVLLGFGWFAGWIVPIVFGAQWLPILQLYPFMALGYIVNAQFNSHAAVLMALDRQIDILVFNIVNAVLLISVTALLTPRLGLIGYGWAELAAIPAYLVLHVQAERRVGRPDYRVSSIWIVGAGIGLFWRQLGPWAIAAPFVALLTPPSVRLLRKLVAALVRQRTSSAHA